jgi:hypothetical protein
VRRHRRPARRRPMARRAIMPLSTWVDQPGEASALQVRSTRAKRSAVALAILTAPFVALGAVALFYSENKDLLDWIPGWLSKAWIGVVFLVAAGAAVLSTRHSVGSTPAVESDDAVTTAADQIVTGEVAYRKEEHEALAPTRRSILLDVVQAHRFLPDRSVRAAPDLLTVLELEVDELGYGLATPGSFVTAFRTAAGRAMFMERAEPPDAPTFRAPGRDGARLRRAARAARPRT